MKRLLFAFALLLAVAWPARAQQLSLQIQDGRVTLEAAGVPARQILAEWARVGGTKVVGADKITGPPLTLKLVSMPEQQALDIILGNVAGFMAAERQASAAPGASTYDRILILATSSAPAPAQASANSRPGAQPAGSGLTAGTQRRVPPRPPNMQASAEADEDKEREAEEQEPTNANANPPVFTFPGPPGSNPNNPVFMPVNNANAPVFGSGQPGAPVINLQPNANGQPTIYNFVPNADGSAPPPTPTTGFGIVGSPTPGMIQQQPPPPTPGQPRPPPR